MSIHIATQNILHLRRLQWTVIFALNPPYTIPVKTGLNLIQ